MARRALVLVLCLSLAAAASADCATQCSLCAGQGHGSESSVRPLVSAGPEQPPKFSREGKTRGSGVVGHARGRRTVMVRGQAGGSYGCSQAPKGAGGAQALAPSAGVMPAGAVSCLSLIHI